jgi:hypothetical protein
MNLLSRNAFIEVFGEMFFTHTGRYILILLLHSTFIASGIRLANIPQVTFVDAFLNLFLTLIPAINCNCVSFLLTCQMALRWWRLKRAQTADEVFAANMV